MAIASFRSKPLGDLFMNGATRRIDKRLHRRRLLMLDVMNRAESLADVASLPGFHPLAGARRGHYAVTGIGNYGVTFRLAERSIYDLDFLDYH